MLTVAAVRSRVESEIAADMTGWNKSRFVIDLFGMDSRQVKHRSFAVGVSGTDPAPSGQRQILADGLRVDTYVTVRFAYRIRIASQVADYDTALGDEQSMIQSVLSCSRSALHIELSSVSPRLVVQEPGTSVAYFMGELIFRATHRIALAA